jgi:hypothetical protein
MLRRAAFVIGGVIWAVLLGLVAVLRNPPLDVPIITAATADVASFMAICLTALTGSVLTARSVLLAAWCVYLSS